MAGATLDILPDPLSVAARAAGWIAGQIAATADNVFRIALSGGNTPRLLYQVLASPEYRERIDWRRLELFWSDERFVPHDDERSNYRMARETLLSQAPVLIDHIHPVLTEDDPEIAAQRYEATLKSMYGADVLDPSRPLFQLILLGLGEDGHTASLFPGDVVLKERSRWVAAVENRAEPRITLTYPAIQSSRVVAFLVVGEEKAEIVRRVQEGDQSLPATRVRSDGEIMWFLDKSAASRLPLHDTV
ncbi:MAG TPA: 6-phosphogluconolactonase [Rhizomicrobium sp.]|nr:6-phosphogluconolactonase [Rhizomicrobium sp.]